MRQCLLAQRRAVAPYKRFRTKLAVPSWRQQVSLSQTEQSLQDCVEQTGSGFRIDACARNVLLQSVAARVLHPME